MEFSSISELDKSLWETPFKEEMIFTFCLESLLPVTAPDPNGITISFFPAILEYSVSRNNGHDLYKLITSLSLKNATDLIASMQMMN